jgi:hypothetical protein
LGSFHQGGTFKPNNSMSNKNLNVKKNVDMKKTFRFKWLYKNKTYVDKNGCFEMAESQTKFRFINTR